MNRISQITLILGLLAPAGRLGAGGITNVEAVEIPPVTAKQSAVIKPAAAMKPVEITNAVMIKTNPVESAPVVADAGRG